VSTSSLGTIRVIALVWIVLALGTFTLLLYVSAPYGRHARKGWGKTLPAPVAWALMETPSALLMPAFAALGQQPMTPVRWLLLALWEIHYIHRAFVYPLRLPPSAQAMPLSVMLMAAFFNLINASLNGCFLFCMPDGYREAWLLDIRLWLGVTLFGVGYALNKRSDAALRALRKGADGYSVPRSHAFRWVSCPNYLGEIIEWWGWAICTWSLAGLAFAVWTSANLVPRSRAHHRWYRQTFPDYPPERRALIPGIW